MSKNNSVEYYKLDNADVMDVIKQVTDGLKGVEAFCMGNIIKYCLRAGKKTEDAMEDLKKANNYAIYLTTGDWRKDECE